MIHYQLICKAGHEFDSWFRSSEDFDRQSKEGLLACPTCGTHEVSKALMAPNVTTSKRKKTSSSLKPEQTQQLAQARAMALRDKLTENSEYVGENFSDVARKIHYGDEPDRGIYGEANLREIKELTEEGIAVLPLPERLEDKN